MTGTCLGDLAGHNIWGQDLRQGLEVRACHRLWGGRCHAEHEVVGGPRTTPVLQSRHAASTARGAAASGQLPVLDTKINSRKRPTNDTSFAKSACSECGTRCSSFRKASSSGHETQFT